MRAVQIWILHRQLALHMEHSDNANCDGSTTALLCASAKDWKQKNDVALLLATCRKIPCWESESVVHMRNWFRSQLA
jgi:hypothetical protein